MSDICMDVDTALAEVPVNILPLLDDTDFKTRETGVAYNAAGMDLVWNFVTTAGAFSQTAVTPTTSGTYDWTHQGDGMYTIEIPASGGASINNDTEGYGWFSGVATGVLPWRGPVITFRAAAINDSLVDAGTTGLLGPTTAGRTVDVTTTGEVGIDFNNVNLPVGAIPALGIIENGTAQSATSSTLVLRSATSIADDLVNNAILEITGGTGAGQVRVIVDWVSSSDTATVNPSWTTTPDNTSTYIVRAAPPAPTSSAYLPTVLVSVGTGTGQLNASSGKVPATIAAGDLAADSVTSSALAASAVAEIQSGLATQASVDAIDDLLDTEVAAIKAKTDSLTFTTAGMVDAAIKRVGDTTLSAGGTGGQGYGA